MADINLSPYSAESEAISRKLRMAELLNQQALMPMEMPQQAGVQASPIAGLAKLLQGYLAGQSKASAEEEAKALAEKYQRQSKSEASTFLEALQGTPAQAAIPASIVQNATGADAADNPNLEIMGGQGLAPEVPGQAAVGPDMQKALAVALGAQANPTIQAAGGALLSSMMKPAESAFAKINPKDYTKESVRAFMASGGKDMSLLDPLDKLNFQNLGTEVVGLNPFTGAKVGTPLPVNVSVDTTARLQQDRELSDRAFNQLSANQRAQLANDAARIGISAQELYFNTGMQAGRAPTSAPMGAPMGQPTGAPNAPVGAPMGQTGYTPLGQMPAARVAPPVTPAAAPIAPTAATANKPIIDQVTPKERQSLLVAQPKSQAAATTSLQGIDRLVNVAKELSDHPGLERITGKVGQFSLFDTTKEATAARGLQSTLVKQAAVNALQAMREASTTGGAVGSVTEGEWPILEQQLAALNGAQSAKDYKVALTNLQNQLTATSAKIKSAYEMTYGPLKYIAPEYQRQEVKPSSGWRVVTPGGN